MKRLGHAVAAGAIFAAVVAHAPSSLAAENMTGAGQAKGCPAAAPWRVDGSKKSSRLLLRSLSRTANGTWYRICATPERPDALTRVEFLPPNVNAKPHGEIIRNGQCVDIHGAQFIRVVGQNAPAEGIFCALPVGGN